MSWAGTRVGVGARFQYDGEVVEVVELAATSAGNEVVLRDGHGRMIRLTLRELLFSDRARIIPSEEGPSADDEGDLASVVLSQLDPVARQELSERAAHIRELLTGYKAGCAELAEEGEPRPDYNPGAPLEARYAAKADELSVGVRTLKRWVAAFQAGGEAALVRKRRVSTPDDDRWAETALEVMVEHTSESKPSRTAVIQRTNARVSARYGDDVECRADRRPSRSWRGWRDDNRRSGSAPSATATSRAGPAVPTGS